MATLDHAIQDAHYEDDIDTLSELSLLESSDFTSYEFDNSTATPVPSIIPATLVKPELIPCKWGSGLFKSRLCFLTSKKHKQDYKQRGTTTWG